MAAEGGGSAAGGSARNSIENPQQVAEGGEPQEPEFVDVDPTGRFGRVSRSSFWGGGVLLPCLQHAVPCCVCVALAAA